MSVITSAVEDLRKYLGKKGPSNTVEIEKGAIRKFAVAIGEINPLYLDDEYASRSKYGALVAPPTFVAALKADSPDIPAPDVNLKRVLHTDDVIELRRPIKAGDVITVIAELTDVFEKNGKSGPMLFQTTTRWMTDQQGELVASVAMTTVWY